MTAMSAPMSTARPVKGDSTRTLTWRTRGLFAAHVRHMPKVCGIDGRTGMRHGPWLPNVQTAPATYRGPLVYGSGLVFGIGWE